MILKETLLLHIQNGLSFLEKNQCKSGEFKTFRFDMINFDYDSSLFTTTFVIYSLGFYKDEVKTKKIIEKSIDFFIKERLNDGLFSYLSSGNKNKLIPDVDVTSCVSAELINHGYLNILKENKELIIKNMNDKNLFKTWFYSNDENNDIDSVVNANVIYYLGNINETKDAIDYIIDIILDNKEKESYHYYLFDEALYYMMTRSYFNGIKSFECIKNNIQMKIINKLKITHSDLNELQISLALCSLFNFDYFDNELIFDSIKYLLKKQKANGSWDLFAFYAGPGPNFPHSYWFGSKELTTAFCLEALIRYYNQL